MDIEKDISYIKQRTVDSKVKFHVDTELGAFGWVWCHGQWHVNSTLHELMQFDWQPGDADHFSSQRIRS